MATRYKLVLDFTGGEANSIKKTLDDGTVSWIPKDTMNTDYQDYLAWVAEGNTAEAAD
tara:strand:+ start:540 stop:713 length:174 start_codon:yes stop_codon:yes gene_type:complete